MGRVASLNVSQGGVPKCPVPRATIGPLGLSGDKQKHLEFHGGPDRAVSLYSIEQIAALVAEGHRVVPGALGENVTLEGIDLGALPLGARLRLGKDVVIELVSYAAPCHQIASCFADGRSKRVEPAAWSRVYARVVAGGEVEVGDPVEASPPLREL